jgi:hypothetical protein
MNRNRKAARLRTYGAALCLLIGLAERSYATERLVNCTSISAPSAGPWWVVYEGRNWWFDLTATRTAAIGTQENLSFTPSFATSQNEIGWQKLMWSNPSGVYACYVRETPIGNGLISVDWIHRSVTLFGSFNYVWNGDECEEHYVDEFDPFLEEPPAQCPMGGSNGEEDDTESEVTQTGGWSYLCGEFDIPPGEYDVYVDGFYQETIQC